MHFTVLCSGSDPLGLRELLEKFGNEQWLPAHVTDEEAASLRRCKWHTGGPTRYNGRHVTS